VNEFVRCPPERCRYFSGEPIEKLHFVIVAPGQLSLRRCGTTIRFCSTDITKPDVVRPFPVGASCTYSEMRIRKLRFRAVSLSLRPAGYHSVGVGQLIRLLLLLLLLLYFTFLWFFSRSIRYYYYIKNSVVWSRRAIGYETYISRLIHNINIIRIKGISITNILLINKNVCACNEIQIKRVKRRTTRIRWRFGNGLTARDLPLFLNSNCSR
jgi:hypothetical protein